MWKDLFILIYEVYIQATFVRRGCGRLLICYCLVCQEARGLDAGPRMVERLMGHRDSRSANIAKCIADEEVAHVGVGVSWFLEVCRKLDANPAIYFQGSLSISHLPRGSVGCLLEGLGGHALRQVEGCHLYNEDKAHKKLCVSNHSFMFEVMFFVDLSSFDGFNIMKGTTLLGMTTLQLVQLHVSSHLFIFGVMFFVDSEFFRTIFARKDDTTARAIWVHNGVALRDWKFQVQCNILGEQLR